jgi:hypothetical protein
MLLSLLVLVNMFARHCVLLASLFHGPASAGAEGPADENGVKEGLDEDSNLYVPYDQVPWHREGDLVTVPGGKQAGQVREEARGGGRGRE